MTSPWLHVIGIGEDGLPGLGQAARAALDQAEVLVGGERHLAMLPADERERLVWPSPLSALIGTIVGLKPRRVGVLATGDPMWFGIGATLARQIPADEMLVIPSPSAFSQAAARLGWALADCRTLTLHGRPLALLQSHIQPGARLLLLAHDGETPAKVAEILTNRGYGASRLTVLERMGGERENRIDNTAVMWGSQAADPFHTLAIECVPEPGAALLPASPGLPDDAYRHDGQLTKREVRAATLAALGPVPGALLWDVGAGSGSIGIEWMRAAPGARAFAIERNAARAATIAANAEALGTPGLQLLSGSAPAILADLEPPDAIFIGGGLSADTVRPCWEALKPGGRLVANAVTVEGEAVLFGAQQAIGGALTRIAVSRAEPVGPYQGWRPLMPVTQWSVCK
jgi:precorrin-6Y C5,15-methyltransferase (decarboxylating)